MDGSTFLWALFFVILISLAVLAIVSGSKVIKKKYDLKHKIKQRKRKF